MLCSASPGRVQELQSNSQGSQGSQGSQQGRGLLIRSGGQSDQKESQGNLTVQQQTVEGLNCQPPPPP